MVTMCRVIRAVVSPSTPKVNNLRAKYSPSIALHTDIVKFKEGVYRTDIRTYSTECNACA